MLQRVHSSEDEVDGSDREDEEEGGAGSCRVDGGGVATLRTPLRELTDHTSVVIAADWLPGGDQAITAAWDRTANLYDTHTGELLSQLIGQYAVGRRVSGHFFSTVINLNESKVL